MTRVCADCAQPVAAGFVRCPRCIRAMSFGAPTCIGCGWPLDPDQIADGLASHPNCQPTTRKKP